LAAVAISRKFCTNICKKFKRRDTSRHSQPKLKFCVLEHAPHLGLSRFPSCRPAFAICRFLEPSFVTGEVGPTDHETREGYKLTLMNGEGRLRFTARLLDTDQRNATPKGVLGKTLGRCGTSMLLRSETTKIDWLLKSETTYHNCFHIRTVEKLSQKLRTGSKSQRT